MGPTSHQAVVLDILSHLSALGLDNRIGQIVHAVLLLDHLLVVLVLLLSDGVDPVEVVHVFYWAWLAAVNS